MVEAYLENHSDRVKERTIGIEVFRRDPDYDTNQDSVVRTTAAEIRKKLAQYYLEPGRDNEIRVLCRRAPILPNFAFPVSWRYAIAPLTIPGRRSPRRGYATAHSCGWLLRWPWWRRPRWRAYCYTRPRITELSLFWKPLLEDASGAVICVGSRCASTSSKARGPPT